MYDPNTPEHKKFTIHLDLGFKELQKILPGAIIVMPYKKTGFGKLTVIQRRQNRKIRKKRVDIEYMIGKMKQWDNPARAIRWKLNNCT